MNVLSFLGRCSRSKIPSRAATVLLLLVGLGWGNLAFCGEVHDAARNGDMTKVQALLKSDPDLVSSKDKDGNTPLHLAAEFDHKDVVELLFANNADVFAKNDRGLTALQLAEQRKKRDIVELLRQYVGPAMVLGEVLKDNYCLPPDATSNQTVNNLCTKAFISIDNTGYTFQWYRTTMTQKNVFRMTVAAWGVRQTTTVKFADVVGIELKHAHKIYLLGASGSVLDSFYPNDRFEIWGWTKDPAGVLKALKALCPNLKESYAD